MNRSLMGRQMFAKGGAAFPDYSGDGEITQKDILMGRGVIPRTMQEGGMVDPMMMMQEPRQGRDAIQSEYTGSISPMDHLQNDWRMVESGELRVDEALDRSLSQFSKARSREELKNLQYDLEGFWYKFTDETTPPREVYSVDFDDKDSLKNLENLLLDRRMRKREQENSQGGVMEYNQGGMVDPMMMQEPAPQGGEVDPEVLAGMFGEIEGQIQGLDQAEDIESMMNAVRGDQQPLEVRRAELAELVGPEDAQETPDSVLALVQPIMQLASVDQGIGGLAADSMGDIAMEGPMAEGIMSTVNTAPPTNQAMMAPPMDPAMMAPPMDPAMMGVGNQPPVNFRYGGAVQYMEPGGVVGADPISPIQTAFDQRKDLYRSIIGDDTAQDQAMLDERRDLTKSQMLFDIANTALAFSTPGSRQMSPAQRLAEAARETQLLDKFGARTGALQDLKDKQALDARSANRSLDMAALSSAEKDVEGQQSIAAALTKARLNQTQNPMELVLPNGTVQLIDRDTVDLSAVNKMGATLRPLTKVPTGSKTFIDADTGVILGQVSNKNEDQFIADQIKLGNNPVAYTFKVNDSDSISTGNKLYIASRQDNLDAFGTGKLDANTANVLEGVLIENVQPTQTQTASGVQTTPAVGLTSAQRASVIKRAELLGRGAVHPSIRSYLFPTESRIDRAELPSDADLLKEWSSTEGGTEEGNSGANPFAPNVGDGLKRETLESPATLQSALTRSGTVNTDAVLWQIYPVQSIGQLISKEIGKPLSDPAVASGVSAIVPTGIKFGTELIGELFGFATPDSVKDLTAAQVVRKNINQRFRNFVIEERKGGRMLQQEFEDLTTLIDETDPKVFSFDATSIQYLEGMQRRLAAIMDRKIPFAPKYGGTSFDQDAKKTQERMRQLNTAASLLSEVTQLKGYMNIGFRRNQGDFGNVATPDDIYNAVNNAAATLKVTKSD